MVNLVETPGSNPLGQAVTTVTSGKLADQVQATLTQQHLAWAKFTDVAGDFATNAAVSLLILVVTLWLSTWISRLVRAAFVRIPDVHKDETLAGFMASLARYVVITMGGIAILNRLGFQTTSVITVLGAASLAIGLALQGALSNVAAGVMVLMLRPYRVGDFVTIAGKSGTVKRLDMFNTELLDPDGLKIVVPNGKALGDVIVNTTDIGDRRYELNLRTAYDADFDLVVETMKAVAAADPRVLPAPTPWAAITDLQPDAAIATLRIWMKTDVYWDARYAVARQVVEALRAKKIAIAYPVQMPSPPAPPPAP